MTKHKPLTILDCFTDEPAPLDFVLPNMLAGTIGALISPGGAGKSMLALQIAIQISGGPDLLGVGNMPAGEVLYLPAEDPPEILHHRLHAIGAHIPGSQRLIIDDALIVQPVIGLQPDIMQQRWKDALTRGAEGKRLMILDTLRRFHTEDENDSGAMAQVVARLEAIATDTGCAIIFLHHTNKGAALTGAGDQQQASRGSSVLVDNVRWQGYLSGMSAAEADKLGVAEDQRGYFVRFGGCKDNYGPPSQATWLRRHQGGVLRPAVLEPQHNNNNVKQIKGVRRDKI